MFVYLVKYFGCLFDYGFEVYMMIELLGYWIEYGGVFFGELRFWKFDGY